MGLTINEYKKKKKNGEIETQEFSSSLDNLDNESQSNSSGGLTIDEYKKLKSAGQLPYDTDAINDYFTQAQTYLSDIQENNNVKSYDWALNAAKDYSNKIEKLQYEQGQYVNGYLESIKGTEQYDTLSKQFEQYKSALSNIKDYLNNINNYASSFTNEEAYNADVKEFEKQQKYQGEDYFSLLKKSQETDNEEEKKEMRERAEEVATFEEVEMDYEYYHNLLDETNAQIKKYSDEQMATYSTEKKQYYANLMQPLYEKADKLQKKVRDIDELYNKKKAQKTNAEYEEKYKNLNYSQLKGEVSDDKSDEENNWLKKKAYEVATSKDYEKEISDLEAQKTQWQDEHKSKSTRKDEAAAEQADYHSQGFDNKIRDKKIELQMKQQDEKAAEYEKVTGSFDYSNHNKYIEDNVPESAEDIDKKYQTINKSESDEDENDTLSYMTETEKGVFNYLYNTGKKEEAKEYIETLSRRLNERFTQKKVEDDKEYAKEHPYLASWKSLGTNLLSFVSLPEDIANEVSGKPIDTNSPAHIFGNETRSIREYVNDRYFDGIGIIGYKNAMGIGDSIANMGASTIAGGGNPAVTSGINAVLTGSQVAANTVLEAKERGLTDDQAISLGVLYGLVETASEKVSVDKMLKTPSSFVGALAKSFIAEGSEEVVSNWGQRAADAIVAQDQSELNKQYKEYLKQGYSEQEAFTMLAFNCIGEDTQSFLVGGVGGELMTGTHLAVKSTIGNSYINYQEAKYTRLSGEELLKSDNAKAFDNLIKDGRNLAANSEGQKLAVKIDNAIKNGETVSASDAVKLRDYVLDDQYEKVGNFAKKVVKSTDGFSEKETSATYSLAQKLANKTSLSNSEVQIMRDNPKIQKAVADILEIDEDSVMNLLEKSKVDNKKFYKSGKNNLIEVGGKDFTGTVEIDSVDKKTGEATYRLSTEDGAKLVKASNITFRNENEAAINAEAARNFTNVDEANAFVRNYEGGDIGNYRDEWNLYSNYGRLGLDLSKSGRMNNGTMLSNDMKYSAYSYGLDAYKAFSQAQYAAVESRIKAADFGYQKGSFVNNVPSRKKLTSAQKNTVNFMRVLSNWGLNVEVFESQTDSEGNFKGENGSFNAKTKTLRIDINAGYDNTKQALSDGFKYSMLSTAAHELTHVAEQGGFYNELRDEIIRVLDENGTDFKELVDKKIAELKKQSKYQDKSAEELLRIADSEVIADGCETMLQDSKLLENLIEGNPGIGKKIIKAIKKIIAQIRAYFKEYPKLAKTEYGQAVLDAMSETENRNQELWDKAVAEGIKATNAGVENANVQFSTRENLLFENSGKNESGDILKVTYDNIDKIPNKLTFSINEDFTFQSKNKSDDIFNYFKNIGGKAVNPDIGVVELNKAGSKSTLFHGFGKEKLASVYGIKDVIEKGVIISHVSNYNDKGYDRYIICGKGSLFGNNETYISVVVKSYPMNKNLNNKFYLHEVLLLEAKKETDSHILTGSQLSDKPVSESVSNNIIPNSSEKSNSSSQQNSDRFNDTNYLSAVERGDMKTAQKMVDEAAEKAGYTIKAYHGTQNEFSAFNGGAFFTDDYFNADGYAGGERVIDAYLKLSNPLIIDAKGAKWDELDSKYGQSTQDIAGGLSEEYDGVIFYNIADSWMDDEEAGEYTVYYIKDSSQAKEADPVTYNDNGNVIPLSERFNAEEKDIRYSDRIKDEYGDLIDLGDDLFDSENEKLIDKLIDAEPDTAVYIMRQIAEKTAENSIGETKSVKLSDTSYQKIARRVMAEYGIKQSKEDVQELAGFIKDFTEKTENHDYTDFGEIMDELVVKSKVFLEFPGNKNEKPNEFQEYILDIIGDSTLVISEEQESSVRENYGGIKEYRSSLGHGLNVALERNMKKKYGHSNGIYISDILEDIRWNMPGIIDDAPTANEVEGFSWLEQTLNAESDKAWYAYDTNLVPVQMGFDITSNIIEEKARQLVNDRRAGQKLIKIGTDAKKLSAEQRKKIKEAVEKVREQERKKAKEHEEKAVARERKKTEKVQKELDKIVIAERQWRDNEQRKMTDKIEQRQYKDSLKKLTTEFQQMILKPRENSFVPPEYLSKSLIEAIDALTQAAVDPYSRSIVGAKLEALHHNLSKLLDENEDSAEQFDLDEDAIKEAQAVVTMIKGKSLKHLTVAELKTLYDFLASIKQRITYANQFIESEEARTISEAGESIIEEQQNLDTVWLNKRLNTAKKYFMTAQRLGYLYNGYNDDAVLVKLMDEINRGVRKKNTFFMQANKLFNDYRSKNVKELDNTEKNIRTIEWTDNSGKKHTTDMTGMQAMQIVMTWNREAANGELVHMKTGGITIADPALLAKGNLKKAVVNSKRILGVNYDFITKIAESLTDFERGYIEIAEDFFNKMSTDAVNEVSMKMRHYKIANSKYYIPVKVDQNSLVKEIEGVKQDSSIEGMGMLKSVTPKSKKAIYIFGLDNVINQHINDVSNYYGLAIPIRNLNKVLNVQSYDFNEDGEAIPTGSVKDALQENWGDKAIKMYEQVLIDLQNSRAPKGEANSQELNKVISNIRSNFVTSTLNANFSVTLKQAASYITAGAYIDMRSLAKGLMWFTKYKGFHKLTALYDEIDSHTAAHYMRRQGLSSNEVADISSNWINKALSNSKVGRKLTTSKLAQKLPSAANPNNWIQDMDCLTTAIIWVATKEQVNKEFNKAKKEIGTNDYWKRVTELYDKTIEDTQPMYDPLHRPEVLKTSNELLKSVFMFKTQPLQNAGIIYDAVGRLAQNPKDSAARKRLGKALASQAGSLVVFSLMSLAVAFFTHRMNRYRDEDDELTAQSIFHRVCNDILINGFGVLMPFGGVEIAGSIFDGDEITMQDNVAAQVSGFFEAGYNLIETIRDTSDAMSMGLDTDPNDIVISMKDFATVAAQDVFGVPVKNIWNDINAFILWTQDLTDGDGRYLTPEQELENKQIANKYGKYIENGDTAEADKLITDYYDEKLEKAKNNKKVKNPESKAKAQTRDMLVNKYKIEYQKAFLRNDTSEQKRIVRILSSAKKYMTWGKGKSQIGLAEEGGKLDQWRKSAKEDVQEKY